MQQQYIETRPAVCSRLWAGSSLQRERGSAARTGPLTSPVSRPIWWWRQGSLSEVGLMVSRGVCVCGWGGGVVSSESRKECGGQRSC